MYNSTLSLTSTLDGVGCQRHALAASPPEKTRYPSYRMLGEPQSRSERVPKISPPPGLDPRNFHPVARRCTDWAIPALRFTARKIKLFAFNVMFKEEVEETRLEKGAARFVTVLLNNWGRSVRVGQPSFEIGTSEIIAVVENELQGSV
jgi:hypothetical protein